MPAFITYWTWIKKDALGRNDKLQTVWLCLQALIFEGRQVFPSFTAYEFINRKLIPFFNSILIPVKFIMKCQNWVPMNFSHGNTGKAFFINPFDIRMLNSCGILIIHFTNGFLNKNRINSPLTTGDTWKPSNESNMKPFYGPEALRRSLY